MMIQLTPAAEQKLKDKIGSQPGSIRLINDSEGCGCVMSAVPGLRVIQHPEEDDFKLESDGSISFYMSRRHEVFFEEALKLDVNPVGHTFRLSSQSQTYSTNVQTVDSRS
ncbi:iron-sulfur cluster biosynthesis family protein [Paenibacillus lemnae]|uniref:Iron-sulfur cluster biosynthesis family protein n=2 Tax=Paenibacillus lemnae TaxID=1330551 RepID=A0A848MCA8_PAELE|nr:iron-sulfur cluster biosynthesis family protein [Paenibacillus lemnae]